MSGIVGRSLAFTSQTVPRLFLVGRSTYDGLTIA